MTMTVRLVLAAYFLACAAIVYVSTLSLVHTW